MYKLGTLEQFEIDNSAAKKADGWTQDEIDNGKVISSEEGESSTFTSFLDYQKNPNNDDEYLWESEDGDITDKFNILAVWRKSIRNHTTTKYYIEKKLMCSINKYSDCYQCGEVAPKQVINFGSQVEEIEIFDTEKEYLARIKELEIKIDKYEI